MASKKNTAEEQKIGPAVDLAAENEALKEELEAMKAQKAADEKKDAKTGEKMVTIRIPRTKADQEDVFVSVNLRTWIIKRGVDVEVPECVAEVIRHQEEVLEEIMLFEEAAKNKK